MNYYGKSKILLKSKKFIKKECYLEKSGNKNFFELSIKLKKTDNEIAKIVCFFYNYEDEYNYNKKNDSMHIKRLGVQKEYCRQGIGTFLMREAILLAEKRRIKHITTHPYASNSIIPQESLEKFYLNFRFNTLLWCKHQIEFKTISD